MMKRLLTLVALFLSSVAFSGCVQPEISSMPDPTTAVPTPTISNVPTSGETDWLAVENWLYQLQRGNAKRIGDTAFDLLVVSISTAGSSPQTFPALKQSPGGPKIVLCYMSIGQAEDYRSYWQAEWEADPPVWLDQPDADWQGDYWVNYWDPDWQRIIFGTPDSYLDQLIDLGCDGVYLDRVDAYEYYAEQGRTGADREMADFVIALARHARQRRPGFGIFPQNAEELGITFPEYLSVANGIGIEDLYYGNPRDHEASPAEWTAARESILRQWRAADKLVLTVDYTAKLEQIADAYRRSLENRFVPYVGDRSLGRLRINPGFEPDRSPYDYDYTNE